MKQKGSVIRREAFQLEKTDCVRLLGWEKNFGVIVTKEE
jgi:hypothetical protein